MRPDAGFMGRTGPGARTSALVFLVLFVHSLPEGLAVGTAYASDRAGLSLFVILAIGIQNVPEGTSVAIPMAAAGFGRARQFWAAVATSAPQPVGALLAYLAVEEVSGLLPFSFAFAAGAMLALIAIEMLPSAYAGRARVGPSAGVARCRPDAGAEPRPRGLRTKRSCRTRGRPRRIRPRLSGRSGGSRSSAGLHSCRR